MNGWQMPTQCKYTQCTGCSVCVEINAMNRVLCLCPDQQSSSNLQALWFSRCIPLVLCMVMTAALYPIAWASQRLLAECTQLNVWVEFIGGYGIQVIACFFLQWHTHTHLVNTMGIKQVVVNASLRNRVWQTARYRIWGSCRVLGDVSSPCF